MDRRNFLKSAALVAGSTLSRFSFAESKISTPPPNLVIIKNGTPSQMVNKALELLGGMARFVQKGERVLIKPNISWDRAPEYAATTNPELVAAVVKLCYQAGASKVIIMDNTCNEARRCYQNSQIPALAENAGAEVRFMRENQYVETPIPNAYNLKSWLIHKEVFNVDKIISIPILKHHGLSQITAGFKNMMGLIGGNRGRIHRPFAENIVDLNRVIVANLTIIDAYRILLRNGPQGGNLEDVAELRTVLAGTDRVLVEAWAAKTFGLNPQNLPYLTLAHEAGMGEIDTEKFQPVIYAFK
jgi:uncharacterized protein (DUF362 family)